MSADTYMNAIANFEIQIQAAGYTLQEKIKWALTIDDDDDDDEVDVEDIQRAFVDYTQEVASAMRSLEKALSEATP